MYDCPIFSSHDLVYFKETIDSKMVNIRAIENKKIVHKKTYQLFNNDVTINTFDDVTHHDLHAFSAISFAENYTDITGFDILVCDGMGTISNVDNLVVAEAISIYNYSNDKLNVKKRVYSILNSGTTGLNSILSLGSFFGTAMYAIGLHMNKDEGKTLGYESHIDEVTTDLTYMNKRVNSFVHKQIEQFENQNFVSLNKVSSGFNLAKLFVGYNMPILYTTYFNSLCFYYKIKGIKNKRIVISYFINKAVEKFIIYLLRKYEIKNLLCAGGLFYNVKLNNIILNNIEGKLSITPLAGDVGLITGYLKNKYPTKKINHNGLLMFNRYDKLPIEVPEKEMKITKTNVNVFTNKQAFIEFMVSKLKENQIVNIILDEFEIGPRALCNTSTIALPTIENLDYINKINSRDTVMPMAPVMLDKHKDFFFCEEEYERVVGSDEYMIITYRYKDHIKLEEYGGVMHKHPTDGYYTGRPQIFKHNNHIMCDVLGQMDVKCLINTSFNIHGHETCFSLDHIFNDYTEQKKLDNENRVHLVFYTNDERAIGKFKLFGLL